MKKPDVLKGKWQLRRTYGIFFQYVVPSVVGMMIGGSFSIVDTVFIGQATGGAGSRLWR